MVTIEGRVPGAKRPLFDPILIPPEDLFRDGERFLVRHLIEKLVRESVRHFHLRERDRLLQALTQESIARGLREGRVGPNPREEAQAVDVDQAIGAALMAFEDGLFLLFVDDEEQKRLEEEISLSPESKVTVIKLTALAGA